MSRPKRDELINSEIYYALKSAQITIEHWRNYDNTKRPRRALAYRHPTPEVVLLKEISDDMEKGLKAA